MNNLLVSFLAVAVISFLVLVLTAVLFHWKGIRGPRVFTPPRISILVAILSVGTYYNGVALAILWAVIYFGMSVALWGLRQKC